MRHLKDAHIQVRFAPIFSPDPSTVVAVQFGQVIMPFAKADAMLESVAYQKRFEVRLKPPAFVVLIGKDWRYEPLTMLV